MPRLPSDQRTGQPTKNFGSSVFWMRLSPHAAFRVNSRTLAQTKRENGLIAAGNLRPKERKTRRRLGRRQSSRGAGTGLFPSAWHKAVCWLPPAAASCDQLRREASPVVGEGLARRSAREVGGTNLNTTQQRKQTGGAKATASLTNFLNSAAMNFCP